MIDDISHIFLIGTRLFSLLASSVLLRNGRVLRISISIVFRLLTVDEHTFTACLPLLWSNSNPIANVNVILKAELWLTTYEMEDFVVMVNSVRKSM